MGGDLTLADNPGGGALFSFAVSLPEAAAARRRAPRRLAATSPVGAR